MLILREEGIMELLSLLIDYLQTASPTMVAEHELSLDVSTIH